MFNQEKKFRCVWLVVLVVAAAAWARRAPGYDLYPSTSVGSTSHEGSAMSELQSVPQTPQGPTGATGDGSNHRCPDEPTSSFAVTNVAGHDSVTGHDSASDAIQIEVTEVGAEPPSADNKPPTTLTVKAETLLELHEMRESAVGLCLQLPTKYRSRLPQCVDIFKHEIRLEEFAKHNQ